MPSDIPARFAFVDDDRELRLGVFETVTGLFAGHTAAEAYFEFVAASDWFPVEFTVGGLRPEQPLVPGEEIGWCAVEILSDVGESIGHYAIGATEVERLRRRADGAFDVTVTGQMTKPPERGVEPLWDRWRTDPPETVNTWAELPAGQREAWLEVASKYRWRNPLRRGTRHARHGEELPVLILDGRYATDLASVYCALGEAVNGPGGYYGSNPYALRDCLHGGEPNYFGLPAPFILVWQAYEVALQHVDEIGLGAVLGMLAESGVRLEKQ
ncbi:barstar family protein [Actinoplanes sp. ATCC 53533]|uniref:barstar family protein n=1 Tax=Actinoplanes sp. ATCC 53533 TaxID=1288362 RepID=UPI000F7ABA44|nr:barstar family protein [Actinoplanes sp. ATCC 53533]